MRRHSNVRQESGTERRAHTDASSLPIPDPRQWPAHARAWLREVKGENAGPWDVAIFHSSLLAAMYLEDAVTALGILDVEPSGWDVDGGFPIFAFDSRRVDEYSQHLTACGYVVRVFEPIGKAQKSIRQLSRAPVVDIAIARAQKAKTSGAAL